MTLAGAVVPMQAAATAPVLLQVTGLAKHYGDQRALADVSFPVMAGEVLGLIGPNGAGKTTLLEAIAGVLPPDRGAVLWRGAALTLPLRRQYMFYLPDGAAPVGRPACRAGDPLLRDVYGLSADAAAETVHAVGLEPVLRKRVAALSKGYGRRLMLALALLTPHPLLLMDEPFDGFDLRQTRDIMRVLRMLAAAGRTLVLAIHQLNDAERVCDRFVLLADGRVRGTGTLVELRAQAGKASAGLEDVFLALT